MSSLWSPSSNPGLRLLRGEYGDVSLVSLLGGKAGKDGKEKDEDRSELILHEEYSTQAALCNVKLHHCDVRASVVASQGEAGLAAFVSTLPSTGLFHLAGESGVVAVQSQVLRCVRYC